jgi:hypothetical protein
MTAKSRKEVKVKHNLFFHGQTNSSNSTILKKIEILAAQDHRGGI